MKIGIVVAMEEEFQALSSIFITSEIPNDIYKIYNSTYKNLEVTGIISKIGKAASASATTHLINKYDPDILINMGSCGGLNNSKVASVILSNKAGYCDVDVQAFGYKLGQLPQQPEFFQSSDKIIKFEDLLEYVNNKHKTLNGFVITGDSFISDSTKVNIIKNIYPNTLAVEMEAAAFSQICTLYKKDFLLIKKVSDMADSKASESFKDEINRMSENTTEVLNSVLDFLNTQ